MSQPLLFMSHAGVDSDAALALVKQIEDSPAARQANLKVWIDKRDLQAGTPWQDQLESAIVTQSTAFAIYLTDAGAEHWVRKEVRSALDRVIADGRRGRRYPFIPIVATGDSAIGRLPHFAQQYQGISLSDHQGLQKLIAASLDLDAAHNVALIAEPFRGLEAFRSADAHLYFGRNTEISELVERCRLNGLVFVVGSSGSGKSSLVKAGLVPAFREGQFAHPMAPRPDSGSWHVVEMRPLSAPIEEFIWAISGAARTHAVNMNTRLFEGACERLRQRQATALIDALRESAPVDAQILLVVDQFEELWTQTLDADERTAFIDGLLHVVETSNLRVRVVATMRRDHFFQTANHEALHRKLEEGQLLARYNLRRMSPDQLRDCVEKPLALAGTPPGEAKAVADEILRDAGDEPGELALMEMALFKTWGERSGHPDLLTAYKAIGRIEGALGRAADEALGKVEAEWGAAAVELAEGLFMRLAVQSMDGGVTRRRATRDEFQPKVWRIAQQLGSREFNRLLVIGGDGDMPNTVPATTKPRLVAWHRVAARLNMVGDADHKDLSVELAHEQIATQWGRYLHWMRSSPERSSDKQTLDRLIPRVKDWVATGRRRVEASASRTERTAFTLLSRRRPNWISSDERAFIGHLSTKARIPVFVGVAALISVVSIAGFVYFDQRERLIAGEATALWHKLTVEPNLSDQNERAILALKAASPAVRHSVVTQMRMDPVLAERFAVQPEALTRALVGEGAALRAELTRTATTPMPSRTDPNVLAAMALLAAELDSSRAGEPLLRALQAASESGNSDVIHALRPVLQNVVATLEPTQIERAVETLLSGFSKTDNPFLLERLAQGLAAFPIKLDARRGERAIEPLLKAMSAARSPFVLESLASGLAHIATALDAMQAKRAVELFIKEITKTRRVESENDVRGWIDLFGKLEATHAEGLIEPLLEALARTNELQSLTALARVLAAVPAPLDASQAKRAIEPFFKAFSETSDKAERAGLLVGLTVLATKLDSAQAERAVKLLFTTLLDLSYSESLERLSSGFADVAARLDRTGAEKIVTQFLDAHSRHYILGHEELPKILAAVCSKLDEAQAKRANAQFLQALSGARDSYILRGLAYNLAVIPAKLDETQAKVALEPFLVALSANRKEVDLHWVADGLAAVAVKLNSSRAELVIQPLLKAISATSDPNTVIALARALTALPTKLSPSQTESAIEPLLKAFETSDIKESGYLTELSQVLAAIPVTFESTQVERAVKPLIKVLSDEDYIGSNISAARGLTALATKLNAAQAEHAIKALLLAISKTRDWHKLESLAQAVTAIAAKLDANGAGKAIRSALENPFLNDRALRILIGAFRSRPPSGLSDAVSHWDILAWSPK